MFPVLLLALLGSVLIAFAAFALVLVSVVRVGPAGPSDRSHQTAESASDELDDQTRRVLALLLTIGGVGAFYLRGLMIPETYGDQFTTCARRTSD